MKDVFRKQEREKGVAILRNDKLLCVCPTEDEVNEIVDVYVMLERIAQLQDKGDLVISSPDIRAEEFRVLAHRLGWI